MLLQPGFSDADGPLGEIFLESQIKHTVVKFIEDNPELLKLTKEFALAVFDANMSDPEVEKPFTLEIEVFERFSKHYKKWVPTVFIDHDLYGKGRIKLYDLDDFAVSFDASYAPDPKDFKKPESVKAYLELLGTDDALKPLSRLRQARDEVSPPDLDKVNALLSEMLATFHQVVDVKAWELHRMLVAERAMIAERPQSNTILLTETVKPTRRPYTLDEPNPFHLFLSYPCPIEVAVLGDEEKEQKIYGKISDFGRLVNKHSALIYRAIRECTWLEFNVETYRSDSEQPHVARIVEGLCTVPSLLYATHIVVSSKKAIGEKETDNG